MTGHGQGETGGEGYFLMDEAPATMHQSQPNAMLVDEARFLPVDFLGGGGAGPSRSSYEREESPKRLRLSAGYNQSTAQQEWNVFPQGVIPNAQVAASYGNQHSMNEVAFLSGSDVGGSSELDGSYLLPHLNQSGQPQVQHQFF